MLTLIWRENARSEVKTAFDYIAERDGAAADRLLSAIMACAERLPQFPYLYRPGRMLDTREAVIHPNYERVYRVGLEAIEIVNFMHARRQYPK